MRHIAERLLATETVDAAPTRQDLDFLARMLGVDVHGIPVADTLPRGVIRLAGSLPKSDAQLAADIESRLADPIAVARAYRRVGELLEQCAAAHSRASVGIQGLN